MRWQVGRVLLLVTVRELSQADLSSGVGAVQVQSKVTLLGESLSDSEVLHGSAAGTSNKSHLTIFTGGFLAGLMTASILFGSYFMYKGYKARGETETYDGCTPNQRYGGKDMAACPGTGEASDTEGESLESLQCFWPRTGVLIALMLFQSLSQVVLLHYARLIEQHPSLVGFLTMLVGVGGNIGGQSLVLTVRRISRGEDSPITEQLRTGLFMALLLSPLAFLRAYLAGGVQMDICLTISAAVLVIAIVATGLGTILPKIFLLIRFDPGQAEPVLQVVMDIFGVFIICILGQFMVNEDRVIEAALGL